MNESESKKFISILFMLEFQKYVELKVLLILMMENNRHSLDLVLYKR